MGNKERKMCNELVQKSGWEKHFCMTIENYGLHIYKDKPILGCSIDEILNCKCRHHCGTKTIEIKCPCSDREKLPKEVVLSKGYWMVMETCSWLQIQNTFIKFRDKWVFMDVNLLTWSFIHNKEYMLLKI